MSASRNIFRTSLSWTEGITTAFLIVLVGTILLGAFSSMCGCGGSGKGQIIDSVNNCRNIVQALNIYAADHDGAYPDAAVPAAKDSNTVFRQLVIERIVDTEKMFGAQVSRFKPDGQMGSAPDYAAALEPGENHWAMIRGLDDGVLGSTPLVFETPLDTSWPLEWNADAAGRPVKGRTWSSGRVIVGRVDGSIALEPLSAREGSRVSFPQSTGLYLRGPDGSEFSSNDILDVAER